MCWVRLKRNENPILVIFWVQHSDVNFVIQKRLNCFAKGWDIRSHPIFEGLSVNTLGPRHNGHNFLDIYKCIFLNENEWMLLKISLKFVPRVRITNILALVQIMAWRRPGDKSLSEPMMVSSLTYICVTRPQWVNTCKQMCRYFDGLVSTLWHY